MELFTKAQLAVMRDRTRRRNYSAEAEKFRLDHQRDRAWGLQQRHAQKMIRLYGSTANARAQFQRRVDELTITAAPASLAKPTTPERLAAGQVAPGQATAGQVAPGQTAAGQAAPEQIAPEQAAAEQAAPEQAVGWQAALSLPGRAGSRVPGCVQDAVRGSGPGSPSGQATSVYARRLAACVPDVPGRGHWRPSGKQHEPAGEGNTPTGRKQHGTAIWKQLGTASRKQHGTAVRKQPLGYLKIMREHVVAAGGKDVFTGFGNDARLPVRAASWRSAGRRERVPP